MKFDHQSEKKELALGSYLAGTYAMRKNQQELASEYFTDVLKANPSNVNILNQAIASLAFQGKISESILLARDQITYDSTSKIGRLLILVDALDRSDFIKIKPNDTIIINQKLTNLIFSQLASINTVLSLITLYIQISNAF